MTTIFINRFEGSDLASYIERGRAKRKQKEILDRRTAFGNRIADKPKAEN